MDCKQIHEELSAYIDGMLAEPVLSKVEAHLRSCPGCAAEMEELQEVVDMVRNLGEVSAPEGFRDQVMARLDGGESYVPGQGGLWLAAGLFRRFTRWGQLTAVAAFLIVGIGISLLWGKGLNPDMHSYPMSPNADLAATENSMKQKAPAEPAETKESVNAAGSAEKSIVLTDGTSEGGSMANSDTAVKSPKRDNISLDQVPQASVGGTGARPPLPSRSSGATLTSAVDSGKMISGGTFKIEVKDPAAAESRITALAAELGGRVEKAGEGLKVVVPGRQFDRTVAVLEQTGQVVSKQINTRDVSREYSDLVAKIDSLEVREKQLAGQDSQTYSPTPKTAAVADLSQVTTELAQLKQQLAAMESEINFASISVELSTKG